MTRSFVSQVRTFHWLESEKLKCVISVFMCKQPMTLWFLRKVPTASTADVPRNQHSQNVRAPQPCWHITDHAGVVYVLSVSNAALLYYHMKTKLPCWTAEYYCTNLLITSLMSFITLDQLNIIYWIFHNKYSIPKCLIVFSRIFLSCKL